MKRKVPMWKKFKQKPSERLKRGIYKLIPHTLKIIPLDKILLYYTTHN